jgi:hypothetical protein
VVWVWSAQRNHAPGAANGFIVISDDPIDQPRHRKITT